MCHPLCSRVSVSGTDGSAQFFFLPKLSSPLARSAWELLEKSASQRYQTDRQTVPGCPHQVLAGRKNQVSPSSYSRCDNLGGNHYRDNERLQGACYFSGPAKSFGHITSFSAHRRRFRSCCYKSLVSMSGRESHITAHGPDLATLIHLLTMTEPRSCGREHVTLQATNTGCPDLCESPVATAMGPHEGGALNQLRCVILQVNPK